MKKIVIALLLTVYPGVALGETLAQIRQGIGELQRQVVRGGCLPVPFLSLLQAISRNTEGKKAEAFAYFLTAFGARSQLPAKCKSQVRLAVGSFPPEDRALFLAVATQLGDQSFHATPLADQPLCQAKVPGSDPTCLELIAAVAPALKQVPAALPKPVIHERSRVELLSLMLAQGSLTLEESQTLECQLSIISYGIRQTEDPPRCSVPLPGTPERKLIEEVSRVAQNVKKNRGFFPRETQLIATLLFLQGNSTLLQASTGQGKSLIVAMTAIVQSKLGRPPRAGDSRPMAVHILAPTDNLAEAGFKENEALFRECGVRARPFRVPGTSADIVYGTPFDFEAQALKEASNPRAPRQLLDDRVRRTVLMDESDSHLIDGAASMVLQSDPDPQGEAIQAIMKQVAAEVQKAYAARPPTRGEDALRVMTQWVTREHPALLKRWEQEGATWVRNAFQVFDPGEGNSWRNGVRFVLKKDLVDELQGFLHQIQTDLPALVPSLVPSMTRGMSDALTVLERIKELHRRGVPPAQARDEVKALVGPIVTMLEALHPHYSALSPSLRSQYERFKKTAEDLLTDTSGRSYQTIFSGQVQYLNEGTGQVIENMKFKDGIQEFLELKNLGRIITQPTLSVRSYSMDRYLRNSDLVLGLSGTVGATDSDLMNFQRRIWQIPRARVLPEFATPQLRRSAEPVRRASLAQWLDSIEVATRSHSAQPVLIVAENPERAAQVFAALKAKGLDPAIYADKTDEHLLSEKLGPGRIIVTTNLGGRGSDYKYDETTAPAGLHTIIAFDSDEERIMAQARGRSGRAGAPGTWQCISFGPPLRQKPDLKAVTQNVQNVIMDDMIFELYSTLSNVARTAEEGRRKEFEGEIMSWLSTSEVRAELRKVFGKVSGPSQALAQQAIRMWTDYLRASPDDPKKAGFLSFMRTPSSTEAGSPVQGVVAYSELARALEPHHQELSRLWRTL